MSFTEKIGALMQRPNDDLVSKDDVPWWLKYCGRGLGTIGGGISLVFGLLNVISFSFHTIFAGILQAVIALSVLAIEAPCCCMFVDYIQDVSNFAEKRPYWNRAAYYMAGGILPIFISPDFTIILGSGLVLGTGVLYGMMALGKKASSEEMRNTAATVYSTNNQQFPPAAASNSNLVEGAQPVSFSNPFDSRV